MTFTPGTQPRVRPSDAALQAVFSPVAAGDPESSSRFAQLTLHLLQVAAAEEAQRQTQRAAAWSAQVLGSRSGETARAWNAYQRRLAAALEAGPVDLAAVRRLAAEAPTADGEVLAEFQSLLTEQDPQFFAEGALDLAERNLRRDRSPAFSQELLRLAAEHPATHARAEGRLAVLRGGGGFGAQLEFQGPRLLRELSSPLMLASFGTAMLGSRAVSLAILARSSRLGWSTLLLSEGAALAVEVPAFTFSRRLGNQMFLGGEGVFDPASLPRELLAGYTSFGLLRLSGNALQVAAPALRRWGGLNAAGGEFSGFGRFTFESLRFGGDFAAIAGAHSLNTALGLEPAAAPGSSLLLQSLLTVGQLRLAGRVMHSIGMRPLEGAVEAQRQRLLSLSANHLLELAQLSPEHPLRGRALGELGTALRDGRITPFAVERWISGVAGGRNGQVAAAMQRRGLSLLAGRFGSAAGDSFGDFGDGFGWNPQLAFARAGRTPRWRDPRLEDVMFMAAEGGDNDGKGPDSGRAGGPPTRRAALVELLQQNLDEYMQNSENRDTLLFKAAKRLQEMLDRSNDRPDLVNDPEFARAMEELEIELQAARAHESSVKRSVETIKMLFRRSAASGHPQMKPEVVEAQSAELDAKESERSAFASSLTRIGEVLQRAKDYGWSESLYAQLERAKEGVDGFYGRTVLRIPGLNKLLRRSAVAAELLNRGQGAALGLALNDGPGRVFSPVAQRLLAANPPANAVSDPNLELLHESILLAARRPTEPVEVQKAVHQLAESYHVGEETAAAMALSAETVSFLIRNGAKGPDLLEHLNNQVEALLVRDRFILLDALRDPRSDLALGLDQVGARANASNYFASGLFLFLRSCSDAAKFPEMMAAARGNGSLGFHPSLAASFFGAAHGRKAMPDVLVPPGPVAEAFLQRAFPK